MTQFFKLVAELGLPIAATVGMGVFILFIIKYILNGIVNSIKFIESVISQLDNRVKTMNNDILKIYQEVSEQPSGLSRHQKSAVVPQIDHPSSRNEVICA